MPERYEHTVVCPWCDYHFSDCFEWADSNENEECDECGGLFDYERIVSVDYTSTGTKPPPEAEDEGH